MAFRLLNKIRAIPVKPVLNALKCSYAPNCKIKRLLQMSLTPFSHKRKGVDEHRK